MGKVGIGGRSRLLQKESPLNGPSATLSSHYWYLHMHPRIKCPPLAKGGSGGVVWRNPAQGF